jgi:Domain of unknown function (DUF4388)
LLTGSLEEFSLADVFRLLSLAKKTGRLEVVRQAGRGRVLFRRGDVIYAESSLVREPVGQKLVRAGAATEGQLRKALDEQAATGERIGRILVGSGVVDRDALEAAIRSQTEEAIFDLLRWERGEFNWAPSEEVGAEVPLAVSVENLIMEASRRLDELEVIERKVPSLECVPAVAHHAPEGAVEINIAPEEWRLLVLVDGRRTLGEIARRVGYDDFGALRALYGLVSAGLVRVLGPDEPHAADVPQEETAPLEPFSIEPQDLPPPSEEVDAPAAATDAGRPYDPAERHLVRPADPIPLRNGPEPQRVPNETASPSEEGVASNGRARTTGIPQPVGRSGGDGPRLERSAAARELAGLFSAAEPKPQPTQQPSPENSDGPPGGQQAPASNPDQGDGVDRRKRVEDDDQVTRGLISKFIDGVKGL